MNIKEIEIQKIQYPSIPYTVYQVAQSPAQDQGEGYIQYPPLASAFEVNVTSDKDRYNRDQGVEEVTA